MSSVSEGGRTTSSRVSKSLEENDHKGKGPSPETGCTWKMRGPGQGSQVLVWWNLQALTEDAPCVWAGLRALEALSHSDPCNNISDVDSSSSLQEESYVERLSKLPRVTKTESGKSGDCGFKAMCNQYWAWPLLVQHCLPKDCQHFLEQLLTCKRAGRTGTTLVMKPPTNNRLYLSPQDHREFINIAEITGVEKSQALTKAQEILQELWISGEVFSCGSSFCG